MVHQSSGGAGFTLRDGTSLWDLVDVDAREVSTRVLTDPEIYQIEQERIFGQTWTVVAHESEIPSKGDFVTRHIGEDPVIVSRDSKGDVQVLLNSCTHRGVKVCRAESGNSRQFQCPYHGWAFDGRGGFLGAPIAREQMHGQIRTKAELSLRRAKTANYAGMIFATFNENAEAFDDYLGDIRWYLDLMFDRTDDGLEVLGAPQRFLIPTNWKCPGEQHAGDGFHALTLHSSLLDMFQADAGPDEAFQGGLNISWNGHGLRCIDNRKAVYDSVAALGAENEADPLVKLGKVPLGINQDQVRALANRFSPEALRVLADFPPQVGGLFPNMGVFSNPAPLPDGPPAYKMVWHAFVPRGPRQIEFFNWYLVDKKCADEERERISRAATMSFGVSGFVEQDDAEMWPSMTEASSGYYGRKGKLRYQAIGQEGKPAGWPGGAKVYEGFGKDDNQWNWWLRWADLMSRSPAAVSSEQYREAAE